MLPAPLPILIVETLKRKGTPLKDVDLYREIKQFVEDDLSPKEFNKALMVLEIRKVVYVEIIKKDLRLVHLLEDKRSTR